LDTQYLILLKGESAADGRPGSMREARTEPLAEPTVSAAGFDPFRETRARQGVAHRRALRKKK
jgi:hypothetical protein